ncbi:hypothetical protein GI374_06315 [Paracoccus sp. S-4012]|uniref:DUF6497 family protein n=1 Tax=Paracoccus sp. S-4012 TaxID=2665648 RepID=UPI0012B133D4|nr:DUF6497 family protein [Paracoccus sp. S-4012]MRX50072.1 hypothetical protein [Paracoccus sp. S-4012]
MGALLASAAAPWAAATVPAAPDGEAITAPSGAELRFVDTVRDVPGPAGVTWRYRFIMPDLASLVPVTTGDATGDLTEEDMAELDSLGLDISLRPGTAVKVDPLAESELVDPEDLDLPDFRPEDFVFAEDEFDAPLAVPADPDILLQDPVHADIAWICENWVLPRVAADTAPRPAQIIISVSDRPTEFGAVDIEAVQLFEAFSISDDGRHCIWEPW